jgi:ABC-2 type transport system permease protein
MLIYAIALCSYTIAQAFASTFMWMVPNKIRMGDFDHTLTRPMPPMLYEIATGFSGYYFWHFILTFFMIGICVVNLGIQLTFIKLLTFAVLVLGAMWVQAATIILFSAASFWLIGDNPLSQIYMEVRAMAEYPISIYSRIIQVFLTVVLPFGFIAFYPAQYFLGKSDFLMFGPWVQFASPAVGLVMLVIATYVWNFAVKYYSSSGS